MDSWAIIYNPAAGRFTPARLESVQRELHSHGVQVRLLATGGPGHATELARSVAGVRIVAAFGGDGTLNEVANGLLGRELPLLFLPGGTANVMAYELGVPIDPLRAAVAGLRPRPQAVRPGLLNARAFLLMAGFGFDGEAVRRVSPRLKAWTGRGAYLWSGLRALAVAQPDIAVRMNGAGEMRGAWVIVARAAHYGGPYRVHPDAGLLKPHLGLVAVRRRWVVPFLAAHLGLNLHRERRGVALRTAAVCRVECDRPVPVQVDGEFFGRGQSFTLGLSDRSVQMCLPWGQQAPAQD